MLLPCPFIVIAPIYIENLRRRFDKGGEIRSENKCYIREHKYFHAMKIPWYCHCQNILMCKGVRVMKLMGSRSNYGIC
jgi:hypothetical protein